MQNSTFFLLAVAILALLPSAFTFMLAPTPLALRSTTTSFRCPVSVARARTVALRMSMPDEDEEDGLEECMLVMKPCDPGNTIDEDECLDEEALEACVEKSEQELQAKMAQLAVEDKKEEMLRDGSF